MRYGEALELLGLEYNDQLPTERALQRAFRRKAIECHPDKVETDDTSEFIALTEAFEIVLQHVRKAPKQTQKPVSNMKESERLDKHFFGTTFSSDTFDPRKWESGVPASDPAATQCVWRCKQCTEQSSVCCRIKPGKHSCICAHKLSDHKNGVCTKCACNRFTFHVQQGAWQAKCSCKHSHRDHAVSFDKRGKMKFTCTKHVPGHRERPCPCAVTGFAVSWVCTCGHGWSEHETVWCANVSKALFGREWVAAGVRPECSQEAEENRQRWADRCADHAAMTKDPEEAKRKATALARKIGLSAVAEAKMIEAVDDLSMRFLTRARFQCAAKQGVAFRSKAKMIAKTDRILKFGQMVEGEMFLNWVKIGPGSWIPRKGPNGVEILRLTTVIEVDNGAESACDSGLASSGEGIFSSPSSCDDDDQRDDASPREEKREPVARSRLLKPLL